MLNRIKRTKFLGTVAVNDTLEKDLLMANWDLFKITRPITFDAIQRIDIQRPDILSLRLYNNSNYWWVLSLVNQIDDWWNDVYVGLDIIVPSINDIIDFEVNVRARERKT